MSYFHTRNIVLHTDREFQPKYNVRLMTDKFYTRLQLGKELARLPFYEQEIEKRIHYDARDKFLTPMTSNQIYGWLERLATRYVDETDRLIFEHKRYSPPDIKVMGLVYMEDRMKKP